MEPSRRPRRLETDGEFDAAEDGDVDPGLSLEELSRSYQRLLQPAGTEADVGEAEPAVSLDDSPTSAAQAIDDEPLDSGAADETNHPVSARSVLEAMLFLGRPDGQPLVAAEVAAVMRGVVESEVDGLVDELNQEYQRSNRAVRVVRDGGGYRMRIAEELEFIHARFRGRAVETRLNQAAIDCLALIAYQPGVSRDELERQRGCPSGPLLNQLVRRQLIEMRRERSGAGTVATYYPTQRLLRLTSLSSLDDLPQADDLD